MTSRLAQILAEPPATLPILTSEEEQDVRRSLSGSGYGSLEAPVRRVNAYALEVFRSPAFQPSARAFSRAENSPFLSSRVHAGQDVATDVSYVGRTILGFTTQGSTALDATLGNSTGINAFLGYNSYLEKTDQVAHAKLLGYHEKISSAQLNRARCAAQMVGGGVYFGVRALTLASLVKGVDTSSGTAPTLLGRVTFAISTLGASLWGLVYLLLAGVTGLELYHASRFRNELDDAATHPDRSHAFIEKWSCSSEVEVEGAAGVNQAAYSQEELAAFREEALTCEAEVLKNEMQKAGLKEIAEETRKELALEAVREDAQMKNTELDDELARLGKEWKVEKLKAKRALQLANLTTPTCAERVRALGENYDPQVAAALATEMKAAMDKNFWLNLGYFVTCLVGVGATIAAFVATAGLGPLFVTIAFLVVALMMTGLDGYGLHDALTSENTQGTFDKKMLAISSGISFASFVASIVLISVLSLGTAPLLASIAIFVVWLGVNAKVWSALPADGAPSPVAALAEEDLEEAELERETFRNAITRLFQERYFPAFTEDQVKNIITT